MEEEEEEKRDTWKPRCVYFSAKPRQMGHFATRRRGFEKRGGGEREREKEGEERKIPRGKQVGESWNETKGERGGEKR